MGDPKQFRKKYSTPMHPWIKASIEEQRVLKKEYGLKNKREIHKAISFLKKYKDIAKKLIATKTPQAEKEKKQIMEKLQKLRLLPAGAELAQILELELKNILDRRIQSLVFKKGLSRSMNQARQFIVHRHIKVKDKEITSPSTLLTLEEESSLSFKPTSALAGEDHPERVPIVKKPKAVRKTEERKTYGRRDKKFGRRTDKMKGRGK